uniref:HMG box domain-containing protein n=1 Tax=Pundamilia nyererei TaxID=303518 RepID=A0A3B4H6I3_9CICH
MMRKDINKPKGKTSAYAFFVQTCREEHRKKNPEQSVNFAEFSKKCSERWKALSPSDKKCFEDMAKADKVRYNREMKDYVPPKGLRSSCSAASTVPETVPRSWERCGASCRSLRSCRTRRRPRSYERNTTG